MVVVVVDFNIFVSKTSHTTTNGEGRTSSYNVSCCDGLTGKYFNLKPLLKPNEQTKQLT